MLTYITHFQENSLSGFFLNYPLNVYTYFLLNEMFCFLTFAFISATVWDQPLSSSKLSLPIISVIILDFYTLVNHIVFKINLIKRK